MIAPLGLSGYFFNHYQSQFICFYGELTDHARQAYQVIHRLDSKLQQVQAKSKNKPSPKVLVVWGSAESFHMALPNSFIGDLLPPQCNKCCPKRRRWQCHGICSPQS